MQELIDAIAAKTGLSPEQARAGLGLLLKLAQDKLGPDFAKLSAALPQAQELIAAAPQADGLAGFASGLLGGLGGGAAKLAGLASVAAAAQKVGLSHEQLEGIAAQAAAYLQAQGGPALAGLLQKAL